MNDSFKNIYVPFRIPQRLGNYRAMGRVFQGREDKAHWYKGINGKSRTEKIKLGWGWEGRVERKGLFGLIVSGDSTHYHGEGMVMPF